MRGECGAAGDHDPRNEAAPADSKAAPVPLPFSLFRGFAVLITIPIRWRKSTLLFLSVRSLAVKRCETLFFILY